MDAAVNTATAGDDLRKAADGLRTCATELRNYAGALAPVHEGNAHSSDPHHGSPTTHGMPHSGSTPGASQGGAMARCG